MSGNTRQRTTDPVKQCQQSICGTSCSIRLTAIKLEEELNTMKNYLAYMTQCMRCQICVVNLNNHYMRYKIIQYKSSTCGDACDWYAKF